MQQGGEPWLGLVQLAAQHVGEQGVVAVPVARVVQRNQEQLGSLDLLKQALRAIRAGHRVTQGSGQAVQDRCAQQQGADPGRQPVEHLGGKVVDDLAVIAAERADDQAVSLRPRSDSPARYRPAAQPSVRCCSA
jgi:hypothetical protein